MKIEIGESLGYSYLRHVKGCWLVQTNWKPSDHWAKCLDDEALELAFCEMQDEFDPHGLVFKGTRNSAQFLKQAEIDVLGVDQSGAIHAMDIAFHEAGLNYSGGSDKRVLKKILRIKLVLDAYHQPHIERHIYFVSPKVHRAVQQPLEEVFASLEGEFPYIRWHLLTNGKFTRELLDPTLERVDTVADTSELFVRSAKLLKLAEAESGRRGVQVPRQRVSTNNGETERPTTQAPNSPDTLQQIVQALMHTLLEDYPSLLDDNECILLTDADYCKNNLGLRLGNYPLLRFAEEGTAVNGYNRYWQAVFADKYYVCSQWGKSYHCQNAQSLLRFVCDLAENQRDNLGRAALDKHRAKLESYLRQ